MTGFDNYVGLGDSISIDDYAGGPGRGAISLLYRNRDDAFPDWRGRDLLSLNPRARLHYLATDGATTVTVLERQMPLVPDDLGERILVTLTVGGNDLLLAWSAGSLDRRFVDDAFDRIVRIVEAVECRCNSCRILVGTVYDPTDGTGSLADGPPDPQALAHLHRFNERIATLGEREGVAVADIHAHFLGHGARHADAGGPHHRPGRTGWYVLDIEPNERGAHEVRRVFWEILKKGG